MKYRVDRNQYADGEMFTVVETATGKEWGWFARREDAEQYARRLAV